MTNRSQVKVGLVLVLALAAVGAAQPQARAASSVQMATFQQGLNGYTGARDTYLSAAAWNTPPGYTLNYGQDPQLWVSYGPNEVTLLDFNVSAIPANALVLSATLSVYNTTAGTTPRYVALYPMRKDWDEGNQAGAQVTSTVGAHGATADYAFAYYPGSGANVPWGARNLAAGVDYTATALGHADLLAAGWYNYDVTALVQGWVYGAPNAGVLLRDSTGYVATDPNYRILASSQAATASQRPKLVVTYNPNVPYPNAGPDQTNLAWAGGAVTLDGSASHDRPGGNNATLTYQWRIVQAAFGSALTGTLPLTAATGLFTPDVAGEWDLALTVTNDLGESAADQVHLQLLSLPAGHPRLYVTAADVPALKARATPVNMLWTQLVTQANRTDYDVNDWGNVMESSALVGLVTGQASYCTKAIGIAELQRNADTHYTQNGNGSLPGDLALVYDWCYPQMTPLTRTQMITYFNTWGDKQKVGATDPDTFAYQSPGWGNYWPRYGYSFALLSVATYGDNARAAEWLNEYRHNQVGQYDLAVLDRIAAGGAWPEGTVYDWVANPSRMLALAAWRSGTGEDLFHATAWFSERLGYLLLQNYPGVDTDWTSAWGYQFHPYVSMGDAERYRGAIQNYQRIMELVLIHQFPADLRARQLQAYLATPPLNTVTSFMDYLQFLWYDPAIPTAAPDRVANFAPAMGQLIWRSGWPTGAADTDPCATYLTFNSGDHFTYHQHYDQNSFTLYKCDDLALDSGVYSGSGLSYHDVNYYVRTIAHNTLVVYNPTENLTTARPDAVSNDGGQRTFDPASRAPTSAAYWDQFATQYDTGDIVHHEEATGYSYALGDATKAYNNPAYSQAQNTGYTGSTPKVTRFQRELVYLRPLSPTVALSPDFVVLYDRVGVVSATYSLSNTKLLFHTLYPPTVSGAGQAVSPGETLYVNAGAATAVSGNGKLFFRFLAPASRNLRLVGGRGQKAFWVFGQSWDYQWSATEAQPRPTSDFDPAPYGEWRLELEPADAGLDHNFLTVMYPTVSTTVSMPATTLVTGAGLAGAHIADPALNRLALFSSAVDGSVPGGVLQYTYRPTTITLTAIVDLLPGARYAMSTTVAADTQTVTLTPAAAGTYQVSAAGVLSFSLGNDGVLPAPERRVYLPLTSR